MIILKLLQLKLVFTILVLKCYPTQSKLTYHILFIAHVNT